MNIIQPSLSIGAFIVAVWSFIILRRYAADTRTIAKSGIEQLENSQMPFLTPLFDNDRWTLQNQGFGPAINATLNFVQQGEHNVRLPSLNASAKFSFHNVFAPLIGNQGGITFKYESLSGLKYGTVITWAGEEMRVSFEKPSVPRHN